jgi:hypothetical protein
MGVSNTIATIPGILGNVLTGWLLKASSDNWGLVFGLASMWLVLGAIVFQCWATDELVFDEYQDNRPFKCGLGKEGRTFADEQCKTFLLPHCHHQHRHDPHQEKDKEDDSHASVSCP